MHTQKIICKSQFFCRNLKIALPGCMLLMRRLHRRKQAASSNFEPIDEFGASFFAGAKRRDYCGRLPTTSDALGSGPRAVEKCQFVDPSDG
jgi:hypothetical protein